MNSKENYYNRLGEKLNNPKTTAKSYWAIIKCLLIGKKVPIIPPLLINNEFVTNFEAKANHFNTFFAEQCSTLTNSSTLPQDIVFQTNDSLSSFKISFDDVLKLIRGLDENKAHGHDGISIRMLKLCDESIVRPLKLIFEKCISDGAFPNLSGKEVILSPFIKKMQ